MKKLLAATLAHCLALCLALCLAPPAFAAEISQNAIACNGKEPLDILTVLAATGKTDALNKTESEYVEEKKCVRLSKGTKVEIIEAKRVLAGDPKIRHNIAHRRIAYHLATVRSDGKAWVMHLQNIDQGTKAGH